MNTINIDCALSHNKYFSVLHDNCWLRHIILGYATIDLISKISKNILVQGLFKISFQQDIVCDA